MLSQLLKLIVFSFILTPIFASAGTVEKIDVKSREYMQAMSLVNQKLTINSGRMNTSDDSIPQSTGAVRELFEKVCANSGQNVNLGKSLSVHADGDAIHYDFRCDSRNIMSSEMETYQFIASFKQDKSFTDLQVLRMQSGPRIGMHLPVKDSENVVVAVALGTLASGLLAKGIYPDQHDKVLHAIVGSLISSTATLIARYGFKLSKNQSFWVGLAAGVIAGVVKEVYDSKNRDKHTVDANDAIATGGGAVVGAGGAIGAGILRLSFEVNML